MTKQALGLVADSKEKALGLLATLVLGVYSREQLAGLYAKMLLDHELATEDKGEQFIVYLGDSFNE